jgi:hypothetical protein
MTIEGQSEVRVRLSPRDWIGILVLLGSIASAFAAGYLRHDRMLSELVAGQRMTEHRLGMLERSLDD